MADAWLRQFVQDTVDDALRLLSTGQALNFQASHCPGSQPLKLAGSPIRIICRSGAHVQVAAQNAAVPRIAIICGAERSGFFSALLLCASSYDSTQGRISCNWRNYSGKGKLKMHGVSYGCSSDGSIDNPGGELCLNHFRTLLKIRTWTAKLRPPLVT